MSGLFGSSLIKGTRITDFGTTTAEIGIPLPFGYGRAPYDGNVIFCPMPPVEQRHVTRQGKGGVKQESFTYSLSYSISFMKGQCYGWWWIKRNGKVVWTMDPNAPIEDQAYAQKWAERVNFHYGTADQMPDAVIESYEGAGNVSAFRNLTYFTVEDDDVTDGGGAVPSYEACLIASPPEAYLTSKVYPQKLADAAELGLAPAGGTLVEILKESALQPSEAELGALPVSGKLQEPPPIPMEPDNVDLGLLPTAGELKVPPPGEWFAASEIGTVPTAGRLSIPPEGNVQPAETEMGLVPAGGALVEVYGGLHAYWRVNVTSANSHCSILELEMAETAAGPNVCTGGTPIAGSQYAGAQHDPAHAFDGLLNTDGNCWASLTPQAGWLGYHFPAPVWIDEMRIAGRVVSARQSPRNFTLQWSDDGVVWYTVASYANQAFVDYTFNSYSTS